MGDVVAGLWKPTRLHGDEESLAIGWRRKDRSIHVRWCTGLRVDWMIQRCCCRDTSTLH